MTEHPPYFCVQTTESVECEPITSLVLSQSSKMMVSNSTGVSFESVRCSSDTSRYLMCGINSWE